MAEKNETEQVEIEQRGTPPYTIWSPRLTNIKEHPGYAGTFADAILKLFELSDAGLGANHPTVVRKQRIEDSTGKIVVDLENQADVQLLRDIDKYPEKYHDFLHPEE